MRFFCAKIKIPSSESIESAGGHKNVWGVRTVSPDNSPAIHGWDSMPAIVQSPVRDERFFCRPSRDFFIWWTFDPAMNGWAIVTASLRDFVAFCDQSSTITNGTGGATALVACGELVEAGCTTFAAGIGHAVLRVNQLPISPNGNLDKIQHNAKDGRMKSGAPARKLDRNPVPPTSS